MLVAESPGAARAAPPVEAYQGSSPTVGHPVGAGGRVETRDQLGLLGVDEAQVPSGSYLIQSLQELPLTVRPQVGENPSGDDHGVSFPGYIGDQSGHIVYRIASHDPGSTAVGQGNGGSGPVNPLGLIGPLAGHQPPGLVPFSRIDGVQVESDSVGDHEYRFGNRRVDWTPERTSEDQRTVG